MKTNFAVFCLLAIGLTGALTACNDKPEQQEATTETTAATEQQANEVYTLAPGTFTGVTPCADCPGINTELELTASPTEPNKGEYVLTEKYLERPQMLISAGTWEMDGNIYTLDDGTASNVRYYRALNSNQMRMLSRDKMDIDSANNYTLTRSK